MHNIRFISFDLDDTLWAVGPVIARAERRFHAWLEAGFPRIAERYDLDALIAHRMAYMRARPEMHHDLSRLRQDWLRDLAREAGYPVADVVAPGFRVFWEARNEVELFPEALGVLKALGARCPLGAITNGNACVERVGLAAHFNVVVHAARAGAAKPHPDIFRLALSEAGVEPHQAVHVGDDLERDVRGAAAVGMRTVWVNLNAAPLPDGVSPDATVTSLDALESTLLDMDASPRFGVARQ